MRKKEDKSPSRPRRVYTLEMHTIDEKRQKEKRGFTLLEIMIAMAVLAITLVAVFQSQSQSVSMVTRSRFETTASLLAKSKMAELEAAAAGDLASRNGDFGDEYGDYVWEVEVEDTQIDHVVKIVLTVRNQRMTKNNTCRLELYRSAAS